MSSAPVACLHASCVLEGSGGCKKGGGHRRGSRQVEAVRQARECIRISKDVGAQAPGSLAKNAVTCNAAAR